jgi:hypothetical protein
MCNFIGKEPYDGKLSRAVRENETLIVKLVP